MRQTAGLLAVGMACLAVAAAGRLWAQARPAGPAYAGPGVAAPGAPAVPDRKVLQIRRMTRLNKIKQNTPVYTSSATQPSPKRPREWAVFEVGYETIPEWLDEVVVTYYIMTEKRAAAEAREKYSFYRTTVRYADVARGEHNACAVLPPNLLLRYGDKVIGIAVEITSTDGTLLDWKNEVEGSLLPAEWWKKAEVIDSKNVTRRDGLTDRSKTPFGLANIDDYEVVK